MFDDVVQRYTHSEGGAHCRATESESFLKLVPFRVVHKLLVTYRERVALPAGIACYSIVSSN